MVLVLLAKLLLHAETVILQFPNNALSVKPVVLSSMGTYVFTVILIAISVLDTTIVLVAIME